MHHTGKRCSASRWLLLAVAGVACSLPFTPAGPRIQVSLAVYQAVTSAPSVTVDVGGRSVSLRASDIAGRSSGGALDASGFGVQPVQVRLLSNAGDTLATVAFSQDFQRGYSYGIGVIVSRVRPVGECVGTLLVTPLRASSTDTLFVAYSGIPSNAVC